MYHSVASSLNSI